MGPAVLEAENDLTITLSIPSQQTLIIEYKLLVYFISPFTHPLIVSSTKKSKLVRVYILQTLRYATPNPVSSILVIFTAFRYIYKYVKYFFYSVYYLYY